MAETTIPDYPRGITFEQVWAALMEDRKQLEKQKEENDRLLAKQKEENDRKLAEQREENDRKLAEQREENDRKINEDWKRFYKQKEENDYRLKQLEDQMGGLHNSFGELAEHMVAPGITRRFNELGYKFGSISPGGHRIVGEDGKVKTEIDILLENGEYIMAVEVKTRPAERDIERHIKRLEILREYRNKLHDPRIIRGAIAGAIFPLEAKEAAIHAGFYVLEQSGDTMKLDVPEGFVPVDW